jgi:erythrocyte band 7 integral membrane protein
MQVLSRDSVTVSVDAVVYYRVKNPIMATNNVEDYRLAPITTKQKSYRYKFATPIHELKQQKKKNNFKICQI